MKIDLFQFLLGLNKAITFFPLPLFSCHQLLLFLLLLLCQEAYLICFVGSRLHCLMRQYRKQWKEMWMEKRIKGY